MSWQRRLSAALIGVALVWANDAGTSQADGMWTTVAPLPTGRAELAATTGADGRIYAIGGRVYLPSSTCCALNTVEAYTARANTWAKIAPMPTARYGLAAVTGVDGRIFALGGENSAYLGTVETYKPDANAWTSEAPMPTAREGLAAATGADGRVYAIGGFNSLLPTGPRLNVVEAYTPSTNTWTTVAPMPTAREGLAAVTGADGRIYALGGESADGTVLTTVEAFSPGANTWTTVAPMPTGRVGLAAVAAPDGRVYAIGGASHVGTVDVYTPATNTWTTLAALPTLRGELAGSIGPDGRIYAIGGVVLGSIGVTNIVEAFTPAPPLPAPTCRFVLGFRVLHDRIPAIVGACLDDEQHNPANGDGLQHTTNGLLVWRKADNFTAFTDGYRTWVHGPYGIQERLNTQRFPWEANPEGLPRVQ